MRRHRPVESSKVRDAGILVVDDSETNLAILEGILVSAGFSRVITTTDPHAAADLFQSTSPDLLIVDLHMPQLDGFGVMDELRPYIAEGSYFPVLVVTGDETQAVKQQALEGGAKDFLTKPFDHAEIVLRVRNLLETRFLHLELEASNVVLEATVKERTRGLERALADTRESQEETVRRLAMAAELRDDDTGQHIYRMSHFCALLAEGIGLTPERCELIRLGSQMHDLGKIGVPDAVLLKPGPLDASEREVMETHAQTGYEILRDSPSELMNVGAAIALTHHERVDGTGYPRGLKRDEIPLEGRIAAIADVFDAMTSDRVYRKAFSVPNTLEMMLEGRGGHFDPYLLDVFLSSVDSMVPPLPEPSRH